MNKINEQKNCPNKRVFFVSCSQTIVAINQLKHFLLFVLFVFRSQIRHPDDETQCITCQAGTIPDRFKQKCQDIPEQYLRLESGWAIGAMAFSSTGMLITFFVVGVFLR